jgi:polysaccharide export outer membrane protein
VRPAAAIILADSPLTRRTPEGRSWRRRRWLSILAAPKRRIAWGQSQARSRSPADHHDSDGGGIVGRALARTRSPLAVMILALLVGCQELPPPPKLSDDDILDTPDYVIAPLDTIQIFVWQAPDLSVTVPVRPDGRITIPLVEDLMAAGKSPTVLARDIENALRPFVQEPKAQVVVESFANQTTQMVKVIGEVARPVTVHYQMHMSVLDVMAEAQGLTEYAAGNDAKLIRKVNGRERTYQLRLNDLLDDGKMSANARLRPGDLIVVPKSLL